MNDLDTVFERHAEGCGSCQAAYAKEVLGTVTLRCALNGQEAAGRCAYYRLHEAPAS